MSAARKFEEPMTSFKFGSLTLDAPEFGSQGSAILGIRDSGKTYTATALAERLYDAGVPWVAFDPIGVWRFLRVPGEHKGGRGYPIVVAGGVAGDLPLTPATAPAIVEAAMHEGVSLVIDLFHMDLSKADWRRIVKDCVRLLLHKNKTHGLRHVFLEEAAEFAPQKVLDGDVYAEIEKLARMGGNSRLGYTLINQRAEEVNKAVLELCDNLFLHRQKGRNSLTALSKWLDVGGVKGGKAIIESLATMPQGECWAWLAGDDHAIRIKGPRKHSLHPDRRVMRGDEDAAPGKGAIDVGKFVAALQGALPKLAAEADANDPVKLRAQLKKLERELEAAKKHPAAATAPAKGMSDAEVERVRQAAFTEGAKSREPEIGEAFNAGADAMLARLQDATATARAKIAPPKAKAIAAPTLRPLPQPVQRATPAPKPTRTHVLTSAPEDLGQGHMRILESLAFWESIGVNSPTRNQAAAGAGFVNGGTFSTYVSKLSTSGYVEAGRGELALTDAGRSIAPVVDTSTSVRERIGRLLGASHARILDALPQDGTPMTRDELAAASGFANGGTFSTYVSKLNSMGLTRSERGTVAVEVWVWS